MSNPRALSTPEHSFSGPKDAENLNQKITDVIMTQESKTPKNVTLDKLEQNNDSFADFFCLDPQLIDSIDQYLYNSNNSIDSANFNTIHTPILTPNNSNSINNNNNSINNNNNSINNNLSDNVNNKNNEIEDDIIRKGSRKLFIDDILENVKTLDSMDKNSLKNNNLDLEITSTPDDKIDDIEFNLSHSRKISKEIDSDNEITDTSNTSVTVTGTTATNSTTSTKGINKDSITQDTKGITSTNTNTKEAPFGAGTEGTGGCGPHTVMEEEESDEDEDYFEECIICSESMRNELKNEIGILDECFHIFCFKCIKTWADRTNLCPICRREFTYIRKINLYYIQYLIDHNKSIINNNITTNTFLSNNSSVTVLGHTATNSTGKGANDTFTTPRKGANSTLMECTSEENLNEVAAVTKSGESGTFSEDTRGAVGASTVTEEIDIFELFKYNMNSNSIGLNNSTTVTGGKKLICNRKNKISRLKKIINVNRNWYDLIPSNVIRVQKRKLKSDEDDEGCQICGNDDNWNQQLLCDICDKGYHTYCLNPPLTTIPETSWYCQLCLSNRPELCNSSVTVTGPTGTEGTGTSNTTATTNSTNSSTNTNNNTTSTNTTITSTSINNRSSRSSRRNSVDRNSISDLEDENMEMRLNLLSQVYRNLNKTKRTKSNTSSVTVTGTKGSKRSTGTTTTKSTNTTSNTNNNTNSNSNKSTKSKKKSNKNQKTTKSSTSSNSLSTGTSSSSRNNINKITNVEEMYSVINNKRIDELIQESIDTIDNYLINNINNTPKAITKGKGANDTFSTPGKGANNTFSTSGKGANSMGMECTTTNTSNNSTTNNNNRMNLFNTRYPNTFTTNTSTSYTNRNINMRNNSFNRNFNSMRNNNIGIRNTNSMRNNNYTNRNNNNFTNRNFNTSYTNRNTNSMSMNEMDDKKYTSFIYRYKTINEEYGNSTSSNIINNKNDKSEPHINGNTVKYLF